MHVGVKSIVCLVTALGLALATTAHAEEPVVPKKEAPPAAKPKPRADVAVGAALARLESTVTVVDTAPSVEPGLGPMTTAPSGVTPQRASAGLSEIAVATRAASDTAGQAREVVLAPSSEAKRAPKPVASVRHQRKLDVARTMTALAPAFEACRATNGSTGPVVVPIRVEIGANGAVERAEAAATPGPASAKPAAECAVAAFSGVRFGAPGGQGVLLTVPVQVLARR